MITAIVFTVALFLSLCCVMTSVDVYTEHEDFNPRRTFLIISTCIIWGVFYYLVN